MDPLLLERERLIDNKDRIVNSVLVPPINNDIIHALKPKVLKDPSVKGNEKPEQFAREWEAVNKSDRKPQSEGSSRETDTPPSVKQKEPKGSSQPSPEESSTQDDFQEVSQSQEDGGEQEEGKEVSQNLLMHYLFELSSVMTGKESSANNEANASLSLPLPATLSSSQQGNQTAPGTLSDHPGAKSAGGEGIPSLSEGESEGIALTELETEQPLDIDPVPIPRPGHRAEAKPFSLNGSGPANKDLVGINGETLGLLAQGRDQKGEQGGGSNLAGQGFTQFGGPFFDLQDLFQSPFSDQAKSIKVDAVTPSNSTGHGGANSLSSAGTKIPDEIQLLRQVAEKVNLFRPKEGQSVRIQLEPPSLGSLRVEVSVLDKGVHADIITSQPLVRDLLEGNQRFLRESLAEFGLKVDHFSVNVGDPERHPFRQEASPQDQGEGYADVEEEPTFSRVPDKNPWPQPVSVREARRSMVDVYI